MIKGSKNQMGTPEGDKDLIDAAWLEEDDIDFEFGKKMDTYGRRVYEIFIDG